MVSRSFVRIPLIAMVLMINACLVTYLYYSHSQETITLNDELRLRAPGAFIELTYGDVHYVLDGNKSSPLMIFIHGGGVTGLEIWKKNINYFKNQGYRILALDLYGRGYSARPRIKHTPNLYRDQILELLEALQIRENFDLVTLSLGALPGLALHEALPGRINHFVLIDPIAGGSFEPNTLLKVPIVSDFLMTAYWYPKAIDNQRKEFVNQSLFTAYSERLQFFQNIEGFKHTNYSTWMHVLTANKLPILSKIPPRKILIIHGDKDPYFGEGQKQAYVKISPRLKIVEIYDSGHMPQYEKPETVNKLMHQFIS